MESEVTLLVMERDRALNIEIIKECESKYEEIMKKETGREYKCKLEVSDKKALTPEADCGGILLNAKEGRIVCDNTIASKLTLVYEQLLPEIRAILFPNAK